VVFGLMCYHSRYNSHIAPSIERLAIRNSPDFKSAGGVKVPSRGRSKITYRINVKAISHP
jgi:hypothetical protein